MFTRPIICVLALGLTSAACSGPDECGPDDAPASGLAVTSPDLETASGLVYGDATTSPNNDCSIDEAPTSLTVDIVQVEPPIGSRRQLILCVPRPDKLDETLNLTDDTETTGVQVIDIFALDGDCSISIDRTRAITGTATFTGACADGTDPAGYALSLDGQIPATKMCMTTSTPLTLSVSGEIAVTAL